MESHQRQKNWWQWNILSGVLLLFLGGCYPAAMDYRLGWTTQQIQGSLLGEKGQPLAESFVLVQTYYGQFMESNQHQLYSPRASVVLPDAQGHFALPFDWKASKISLTFIAPGHVMQSFSFQRQMGVGDWHYQARLIPTTGWQDHLFVTISPFLQSFLIEPRYELAEARQLFLGEWLERQKTQAALTIHPAPSR